MADDQKKCECPFLLCNRKLQTLEGTRSYVIRVCVMFYIIAILDVVLCVVQPDKRVWWWYLLIVIAFVCPTIGFIGAYYRHFNTLLIFGWTLFIRGLWNLFVEVESSRVDPKRTLVSWLPIAVLRGIATLLLIYVYILYVRLLYLKRQNEPEVPALIINNE